MRRHNVLLVGRRREMSNALYLCNCEAEKQLELIREKKWQIVIYVLYYLRHDDDDATKWLKVVLWSSFRCGTPQIPPRLSSESASKKQDGPRIFLLFTEHRKNYGLG